MNRLESAGRNDIILHVADERKNGGEKGSGSDTKNHYFSQNKSQNLLST
jgi:hypothetical protein